MGGSTNPVNQLTLPSPKLYYSNTKRVLMNHVTKSFDRYLLMKINRVVGYYIREQLFTISNIRGYSLLGRVPRDHVVRVS